MAYELTSTSGIAGGTGDAATVAASKEYLDNIDLVDCLGPFATQEEAIACAETDYIAVGIGADRITYELGDDGKWRIVVDMEDPANPGKRIQKEKLGGVGESKGLGVLLLLLLIAFVFVVR